MKQSENHWHNQQLTLLLKLFQVQIKRAAHWVYNYKMYRETRQSNMCSHELHYNMTSCCPDVSGFCTLFVFCPTHPFSFLCINMLSWISVILWKILNQYFIYILFFKKKAIIKKNNKQSFPVFGLSQLQTHRIFQHLHHHGKKQRAVKGRQEQDCRPAEA